MDLGGLADRLWSELHLMRNAVGSQLKTHAPADVPMNWIFAIGVVLPFLLYHVAVILRRVYFHPLSRFPGPRIAAATKWYEFYYDFFVGEGGQYFRRIEELHRQYGPVVRITPEELHFSNPEWHEIIYTGPTSIRDKYPPEAKLVGTPLAAFGTVPHEHHRLRRGAISSFWSKRAVSTAQPIICENLAKVTDILKDHYGRDAVVDIHSLFLAFAEDSVMKYALGSTMDLLGDEKRARAFKNTMESLANATPVLKQYAGMIQIAKKLPLPLVKLVMPRMAGLLEVQLLSQSLGQQAISDFHASIASGVSKGLDSSSPSTIFNAILKSDDLSAAEKTPQRLTEEGTVIVGAGGDTVARTSTHAIFFVLSDPQIYTSLIEEVDRAMPNWGEIPDLRTLEVLPTLTAVIKEVLRITSLFTSRFPLVAPTEELRFGEWTVPRGTAVSMTNATMLSDPVVFPNPQSFLPERWLEPTKEMNRYFVPFGRGTRNCLGMNFAWAELYMLLTVMFRRFEFDLYDTIRERDVDYCRDCFVGEPRKGNKGVRVKIAGLRS